MTVAAHHYTIFETQAGFCGIAWSMAGVTRFRLPDASAEATERGLLRRLPDAPRSAPPPAIAETPAIGETIAAARRYFAGERIDFSGCVLDLDGIDPFFARIYGALRQVEWGSTTTYGGLAKAVGAGPETARGVGQAMARNPVPLIIPCHRVLAAGGKVGGFSAPGGSTSKVRMLALEGVHAGPAQQSLAL